MKPQKCGSTAPRSRCITQNDKSPDNVTDNEIAAAKAATSTSWKLLLLLVAMNGIAPVSLYILVPALPMLVKVFNTDVTSVQLNVSLFMVGLACSQLVTGPLSDKFGRRPVLLTGLVIMTAATIACVFAQTLPQLIGARFFQAVGGGTGMVMARAVIRDLYPRERVGGMLSLVIGVMMIAQLLSPLIGGLIETSFGWRAIFYFMAATAIFATVSIAVSLPETRVIVAKTSDSGFLNDVRALSSNPAFIGYVLCQMLASAIIFTFAGGGPYIVVNQMARSTAEYGLWFATSGVAYMLGNFVSVRLSPKLGLDRTIWLGLALQIFGSVVNLIWGFTGLNRQPEWLFGTHMIVMFGNAFAMSNASAGAISIRPQAAGTASGAMGFLQMGFGSLCSQLGAFLGGRFATPLPLNIAVLTISCTCAAAIYFLVPRTNRFISEDEMLDAEEQESGIL
ncbi:MAG: multidrug effflux MFS transporter [Rhizobiales bacterium]|nr:multidrug effflux MFS transporter [Hyphomicrobiales bacterium]